MEQRITSLLLPAPEAELEASCKELDEKVTWLLHNSRKMDNYLELEPFSKDVRLCAHVCDTLKSLPGTSQGRGRCGIYVSGLGERAGGLNRRKLDF